MRQAAPGTRHPAPGTRHQIYNFEVEATHTYIAGGVRVHNRSDYTPWDPENEGFPTQNSDGGYTTELLDNSGIVVWTKAGRVDESGETVY